MDTDSFNEFSLWHGALKAESDRLKRWHLGIDEVQWQAEHAVWKAWVFNYENISKDIRWGYYPIAHQRDENGLNFVAN